MLNWDLRPFTSKIKYVCRGTECRIYHLLRNIFRNISVTGGGMTLKIYLKVKHDEKISKKKKKSKRSYLPLKNVRTYTSKASKYYPGLRTMQNGE